MVNNALAALLALDCAWSSLTATIVATQPLQGRPLCLATSRSAADCLT